MRLTKNTYIENYIVKKDSNILIEGIDAKYVERIQSDIQSFLKNVNRLKDYDSFFKLIYYWTIWIKEEFNKFISKMTGKNIIGVDYEYYFKTAIIGKELTRLIKSMNNLFIVDEKDVDKYLKKSYDNASYYDAMHRADTISTALNSGVTDFDGYITRHSNSEDVNTFKKDYFTMWSSNASSRYISTKKIVDEVFQEILSNKDTLDMKTDLLIEDTINRFGVNIQLKYHEGQEYIIFDTVKTVESALNYFSRKDYGKVTLPYLKLVIDFVTEGSSKEFTLSSGKKFKSAGLYRLGGAITISNPNIVDDDIITLFAHELGHQYYYQVMDNSDRNDWEQYNIEITSFKGTASKNFVTQQYKNVIKSIAEYIDVISVDNYDNKTYIQRYKLFYKITPKDFFDWLVRGLSNDSDTLNIILKYYEKKDNVSLTLSDLVDSVYYDYIPYSIKNGISDTNIIFRDSNGRIDSGFLKNVENMAEFFYGEIIFPAIQDSIDNEKKLSMLPSTYAGETASEFFAEVFAMNAIKSMNIGDSSRQYNLFMPVLDTFRSISGIREKVNNGVKL